MGGFRAKDTPTLFAYCIMSSIHLKLGEGKDVSAHTALVPTWIKNKDPISTAIVVFLFSMMYMRKAQKTEGAIY